MTRDPAWILRRLLLMSPGEVLHRSVRTLERTLARRRTKDRSVLPRLGEFTGAEFPGGTWYLDLRDWNAIRSIVRSRWRWDESKARELLDHRFTFFAFEAESFGTEISWNRDYLNGKEAPLEFGPTLDYRDPQKCGDIKYSWELNRHHHLVELAKAWYMTGEEAFIREIVLQVDSWIESSPYLHGINWASSLESAIRVINWCFCLAFLEAGSGTVLGAEFRRRWIASIHEHLTFINQNFSAFSSANNHLIGEACGLFVGAVSCQFPESQKWIKKSQKVLEREALLQTWPDGVNKEQALAYQAFVFDFLLLAGQLGTRNGIPFSAEYWSNLEKMAEFVHALIDGDGQVPRIGDDDDGYVLRLSHSPDFRQFRSILATSAILFERGDFAERSSGIDEKTFWLLGETDVKASKMKQPGSGTGDFPHGGYYILSGGGARMVVDCGPLGYLSLAAHGHADALSILLHHNGRPFLVDPGTYAYHTRREWRDYFRGTSAHNTVVLDGEDQSLIGGNFMWSRKARSTLLDRTEGSFRGSHDGYSRLGSPAIHEREVSFSVESNAFQVKDFVKGRGDHRVEQFFHCPPECLCTEEEGAYVIENNGERIRLVPDPKILTRGMHIGETDPIRGWYSPGFDRKTPSPTVRCALDSDGGVELTTMIYLL